MLPIGLDNFGNTCYMNATVQCLKAVPELKDALARSVPFLLDVLQVLTNSDTRFSPTRPDAFPQDSVTSGRS